MFTAANVVPSEIKNLTQTNRENEMLEFTQENYIKIVLENIELNRQKTGLLKQLLALEKEETARIRLVLDDSSGSPHLQIA